MAQRRCLDGTVNAVPVSTILEQPSVLRVLKERAAREVSRRIGVRPAADLSGHESGLSADAYINAACIEVCIFQS